MDETSETFTDLRTRILEISSHVIRTCGILATSDFKSNHVSWKTNGQFPELQLDARLAWSIHQEPLNLSIVDVTLGVVEEDTVCTVSLYTKGFDRRKKCSFDPFSTYVLNMLQTHYKESSNTSDLIRYSWYRPRSSSKAS